MLKLPHVSLVISLFLPFLCFGQNTQAVTKLQSANSYIISSQQQPVTAVVISSERPVIAKVLYGEKNYPLTQDTDAEGFKYFLSLPKPKKDTALQINVSDSSAQVFLINSGRTPEINTKQNARSSDICTERPSYISQSQWREGLEAPNFNRVFHEVRHLIIHHSAGSNSATNFTQVVRDIYLYHTEVNGWSDIGYNYLIAQDGTLYAGRDPDTGEQSLVRGAHFCGANSNTMGVCLLGNYETAQPSLSNLKALSDLLTFESISLDIDPLGSQQHSTGLLAQIAGHQDGCATLCPGSNVYGQLDALKVVVFENKIRCEGGQSLDFSFDHEILGVDQILTLTNKSVGYSDYLWYIEGQTFIEDKTEHSFATPGNYDLGIIGRDLNRLDSLILPHAVKVSWLEKTPIVFPNPVVNRTINIDYRPEIERIVLRDLNGKISYQTTYHEKALQLPKSLKGGVYQLEIFTLNGRVESKKLIIQ